MRLWPDSLDEGICVADHQVHLRLRHEMRTLRGWWPTNLYVFISDLKSGICEASM